MSIPCEKCTRPYGCCDREVIVLPFEADEINKAWPDTPFVEHGVLFLIKASSKKPCPFYNRTKKTCLIYEIRPLSCRIYPVLINTPMDELENGGEANFILHPDCPFVSPKNKSITLEKLKEYYSNDALKHTYHLYVEREAQILFALYGKPRKIVDNQVRLAQIHEGKGQMLSRSCMTIPFDNVFQDIKKRYDELMRGLYN